MILDPVAMCFFAAVHVCACRCVCLCFVANSIRSNDRIILKSRSRFTICWQRARARAREHALIYYLYQMNLRAAFAHKHTLAARASTGNANFSGLHYEKTNCGFLNFSTTIDQCLIIATLGERPFCCSFCAHASAPQVASSFFSIRSMIFLVERAHKELYTCEEGNAACVFSCSPSMPKVPATAKWLTGLHSRRLLIYRKQSLLRPLSYGAECVCGGRLFVAAAKATAPTKPVYGNADTCSLAITKPVAVVVRQVYTNLSAVLTACARLFSGFAR